LLSLLSLKALFFAITKNFTDVILGTEHHWLSIRAHEAFETGWQVEFAVLIFIGLDIAFCVFLTSEVVLSSFIISWPFGPLRLRFKLEITFDVRLLLALEDLTFAVGL
jgi:hypothetical protein